MAVTFPEQFPGTPIPSAVFNNMATSVSYHDGWIESINAGWSVFNPGWHSATGTDPSIGNGTKSGIYKVIGSTLFYRIALITGSTTTYGTDLWYLDPPMGYVSRPDVLEPLGSSVVGNWRATHSGNTYVGIVAMYSDQIRMVVGTGPVGAMSASAPFTWGSADTLSVTGWYPLDV